MRARGISWATAATLILALVACQRSAEPPAAATKPDAAAQPDIEWFAGNVDQALSAAAAQHKPVFLYWGAEWCPPCHDLKAHVFSRRDFQDKIRQFIPVYLDGDAEGAQRIADQYQVSGYPTAVVLAADGAEITRIAGGMDLTRYADVLDLALENVKPVAQLLSAAREGNALDASDCRRLAYNGWLLQPDVESVAASLATGLEQAARACPAQNGVERDRLMLTAAGLAAGNERSAIEAGKPASAQMQRLLDDMSSLLADRQRALRVGDMLLDVGEDCLSVSHRLHPDRDAALLEQWQSVMDALETDPGYSGTVQLMSAAGRLYAAKALSRDGQVPQPVQDRARRTLDAFLARPHGADERAGIINSASWVLTYLKDDARLRTMLEGEIATSRTAYYYMPDLADVYERAGDKATALTWLERGYRDSRGPATRFQWGTLYLRGLLRMSPDDASRIQGATLQVLGELKGPDRIHGRARSRLEKLGGELAQWSRQPGHANASTAIREGWQDICASLPAGDPARQDCEGLLPLPAG